MNSRSIRGILRTLLLSDLTPRRAIKYSEAQVKQEWKIVFNRA